MRSKVARPVRREATREGPECQAPRRVADPTRFLKQTLGATLPRIRTPEAADRWTWLILSTRVTEQRGGK
jgi:hypothetical protein